MPGQYEHQQVPCRKEAHTMTLPLLGVDGASLGSCKPPGSPRSLMI